MMRLATSAKNAGRLMREAAALDVRSLAPKVSCPTLVLHARGDARIPFEEGRLLASLIPGARFVPLPGRNHIIVETEPAWPQLVAELRAFLPAGTDSGAPPRAFAELSPREAEILELIAAGLGNRQIAERLFLSDVTVRRHVSAILRKLRVGSRDEAVRLAQHRSQNLIDE
jgi:DNA-binding CsgD family transcriptional regulator